MLHSYIYIDLCRQSKQFSGMLKISDQEMFLFSKKSLPFYKLKNNETDILLRQ